MCERSKSIPSPIKCLFNLKFKKMAIVQNPITGRSSGKFANAIFQTLLGKNILRSKPLEVYNPRTPGQVSQRSKFSLVVQFLRSFLPIIRIGYKLRAIGQNAFNASVSYNIQHAVLGTSPDFTIDYEKVVIAQGPLAGLSSASIDENLSDAISVSIQENVPSDSPRLADLAYGLFYNATKNQVLTDMGTKTRVDWGVSVAPEIWEAGDVVYAWVFYTSPDGISISDSFYAGTTTLV